MFVSGKHILARSVSSRLQSAVIRAQILLERKYFISAPSEVYGLYGTDIKVEEHTVQSSDLKRAPLKAKDIFMQQFVQTLVIWSRSCGFSIYV